ncbi:Hypp3447 [Branchiostoma lanceolatum]|uniref:Hypp3447 protein n=1 Tax=Branchiostoma lanceolatum TaxID=7740 RepID=A0A8K0EUK8_BRALA|nr:Hypp3447 [Branchiostoma lanceolatum]
MPWMTDTIKAAVRERQSVFQQHGKTDRWKKLRTHIQRLIRKQNKKHYDRCIADLKKTNPRDWWRFVNDQLGRTQKSNGKTTRADVSDNQVADVFNDYFAEAWSDSSTFTLFPLLASSEELCNIGQLKVILKHLQHRKACGPDTIPNWILSLYCEDLAPVTGYLMNLSYNVGTMPSSWKMANVCPIPKTSVPTNKKDWRPISLISSLGKVQERLILNKFLPVMTPWIKDQYAYMPKCPTTLALVKAYQTWLSNLDKRNTSMVRVLLADMSKAFDRVDHGILFQLLAVRDTPSAMLAWIHSYLTGRKQHVVANGQQSKWCDVTSGVPQGGVPSPYLFLVYMSSRATVHATTSNIGYADDIGLSRTLTYVTLLKATQPCKKKPRN